MILYYVYGWNPFKSKEDFRINVCEQIEISNRKHLKEAREEIVKHWHYSHETNYLNLDEEYHETFFVYDQKGNKVDQFNICLKAEYEIYNKKDE